METPSAKRPLANFIYLQTRDVDEFAHMLETEMCDHEWRLLGNKQKFHGQLATAHMGRSAVHSIRYQTDVYVNPGCSEEFFAINTGHDNSAMRYETAGKRIRISPQQGLLISPTIPIKLWQDSNSTDFLHTIPPTPVTDRSVILLSMQA